MTLRTLVLFGISVAALLVSCGDDGGDEEEPTATPAAVAAATQVAAADSPTPEPEGTPAASSDSFSLCLLEASEADDALDSFVTGIPGGNLNCTYQTDSGSYLRFEPGFPDDLEAGAEFEGVEGEPVPDVGEEAVWFGGVEVPSHHFEFEETVTLGVLSLRQGEVYLRIMLNLPEVGAAAQLENAKTLAAMVIPRLPGEEPE